VALTRSIRFPAAINCHAAVVGLSPCAAALLHSDAPLNLPDIA
jgi:hypothetical protein